MAEEREVVARLKTERTGETGAFKEAADDVRELKDEAVAATPAVENLGDAASEAGDAAGDAGKGLGEMGKAGEGAGRSLADVKTQALAAAAAFQAGYTLGTQLRDILNDLSNGGFDRGIQSMVTSVLGLDSGLDSAEDAAQRLANGMRILRANGIDPTGKSAEEVAALVTKLAHANQDSAKIAEDAAAAYAKQTKELGLSTPELDKATDKLVEFAREFERQNQQLSKQDLGKIFEPMVQDILDAFAKLGVDPPRRIQVLADSWGILTSAGKKAAAETAKIVDEMVADITGAAAGLKGSLETQLKTLNDVFSKLDFGNLGAEQIEKAKTFLQQYVDTSRKAGQQIPEDVADQAASLGILVGAMEVAAKGSTGLATEQGKVGSAAQGSSVAYDAATRSLKTLEGEVTTSTVAFDKSTGTMKTVATEVGKSTVEYDKATHTLKTVATTHEDLGKAAKDAGADVKDGATKAGEGKQALEEAGKAAGDAGTGLDAAKKGAEGLGAAGDAAKTAATNLKTPLAEVGTAAGDAATALGSINEIKFAGANSEITTLLANLDLIVTKANAAKAALDAIDDDSASPAPSAPGAPADSGGGGGGGF